jgi:Flp pilus assembly protein TadG
MLRRRRDDRGQGMVEFALIVPVFLLIIVGLLDGALAVFNYSTVSNAARQGARVAIVDQDVASIENAIEDAAVGLDLDQLTVSLTPCSDIGCEFVVDVEYDYQSFFLGNFFSPTISSTVTMPVENPNP